MSRLIESIKVKNGKLQSLPYHIARMKSARIDLWGFEDSIDFESVIELASYCTDDIYKCRIVYNQYIEEVSFDVYSRTLINSLQLVHDDNIDYKYKYENRSKINQLFSQKGEADDIIIVKDGLLTDSSYCNIALYDGNQWITPKSPLLKGTMRAKLLTKGDIIERDINEESLGDYHKIILFNAMIEFDTKNALDISKVIS